MEQIYIPLVSGLVGALIGAAASIITVWIQSETLDRREKLRHAAELALEDYKLHLDLAGKTGKEVSIPPVSLYLHYYHGLMDLMEKGDLNSKSMCDLANENKEFYEAIKRLNEEIKEK